MRILRTCVVGLTLLPFAAECDQSYKVYTEHPRLWLEARRLRLLKRERERDEIRWQQLQLLIKSGQPLPEEPLVRALEYQVAGDEQAGKQAVAWAVKRAGIAGAPDVTELRLLAVVFDWCYPLFSETDRARVVERTARGVASASTQGGMRAFAAAVLAAIGLADDWPGSEQALTTAFEKKWQQTLLPALREGRALDALAERVAMLEMCHAARDNLNLDLWSQAPHFFRQFPFLMLLGYYPPPVTVAGHRFRQPSERTPAKPDSAVQGELGRIAEMLTAAYDTNSVETQFLQGWITHDIYRLRTPTGTAYEFLWMNPYQPGLSYYNVPLFLHDEIAGRLFARSSWDDDAVWVGYFGSEMELFADGQRSLIDLARQAKPIVFPQVAIAPARGDAAFTVKLPEGKDVFIVSLEAGRTYWLKLNDGKFAPQTAGKGGILHLEISAEAETNIELRAADPNPPAPEPKPKRP